MKGRVNHNRRIMTARWWALGVWAAVAATVVYWGLRLSAGGRPVPPQATVASSSANARGDLTRLFGVEVQPAVAAPPPAAARFQLLGVAAPRAEGAGARQGVALIAVDGKPARAYRVGAVIDGDNVLQSVRQRGAEIGPRDGATLVSLDLPPPAPAATGTLPSAGVPAAVAPAARPLPLPGQGAAIASRVPGPMGGNVPGTAGGAIPGGTVPGAMPGVTLGGPGSPGHSPAYVPGASPGMSPSVSPSRSPTAPELAASAARLDGAMQSQ